jgi:hypothetical protein
MLDAVCGSIICCTFVLASAIVCQSLMQLLRQSSETISMVVGHLQHSQPGTVESTLSLSLLIQLCREIANFGNPAKRGVTFLQHALWHLFAQFLPSSSTLNNASMAGLVRSKTGLTWQSPIDEELTGCHFYRYIVCKT